MRRVLVFCVLFIFLSEVSYLYSQEKSERKYFEVYRVVGKGKDIRDAREDAFQNAIIEFLKKNVSPKDLKENSEKILKEIFPSNKIGQFIESFKTVSSEEVGQEIRLVIDVVLRAGKLIETLQKIGVPLKSESNEKVEN